MSDVRWPGIRRVFPRLRRRLSRDIDDEIRFHVESRAADLVQSGQSPDEARRAALAEFGDLDASRAELLSVDRRVYARERWAERFDRVRQDVRWALRGLQREPGFHAGIVLVLALAVGANSAVFSLIDPILFRTPPGLTDAATVRRLYTMNPGRDTPSHVWRIFSYAEYRAVREALDGLARVAVFASRDSTPVVREADTSFASVGYVSADFLPMLARASRGRFFSEQEDDVRFPERVVVLSDRLAAREFGAADPVGRVLAIDGTSFTVIGTAGDGFAGIEWSAVDAWVPFSTHPRLALDQQPWFERGGVSLPIVMRLAPGADPTAVESRASLAYARAWLGEGQPPPGRGVLLGPLSEARGPINREREVVIATRMAAVSGFLLLIAAANVANLLLARAVRRRRETAVQLALGVSRGRLLRQHMLEAAVVATLAGPAALIAGNWSGAALRIALLPRVDWISPPLGLRLAGFTTLITLLGCVLAFLLPALQAGRRDVLPDLSGNGHGTIRHPSTARFSLLVVQATLSMILLAGAALFLQSFRNVARVDMGVDVDRLVVASVYYDDGQRHPERGVVLPDVAERLAATPGVAGAAWGNGAPMYSWYSFVPLFEAGRDSALVTGTEFIGVSSSYFDVTGTRILAGRGFSRDDSRAAPRVMVVSQSLARSIAPGQSALGRCLSIRQATAPCHTIVGVAGDVRGFRRLEETTSRFYIPFAQRPSERMLPSVLVIRAGSMTAAGVAILARTELSRDLPGASVTSSEATQLLEPELQPWRRAASLMAILSLLALIVAAAGVYGSVAFTARQRTRELGVRLALGASGSNVLSLVLREGTLAVLVGIAIGVLTTSAAGSVVSAMLYEVAPSDPVSLAVAAGVLLAVVLIGSMGPAIRSTRTDPSVVLRSD